MTGLSGFGFPNPRWSTSNSNANRNALDQLTHDDPVGLVWFGDNDAWIGKRLRQWRIQAAPDELDGAHVVL